MRPTSIVVSLMALALLPSLSSSASACSCTNEPDFPRAYTESAAIFLGEVLEITSAEPEHIESVWVSLRVEAYWKGDPPSSVRILTPFDPAVCGFPFQVGTRYLVYALAFSGELWTHACWRTHEPWPEDPDLALL